MGLSVSRRAWAIQRAISLMCRHNGKGLSHVFAERTRTLVIWSLVCAALFATTSQADMVLSRGLKVEVTQTRPGSDDLWVSPQDLTQISGFVLKPQGACLDEICVPTSDAMLSTEAGRTIFNSSELARRIKQAVAADRDRGVWSFGPVSATRTSFLEGAMAPDFELPDINGELVRLSDFLGKKVLLLTWASW
jgi:hypothetical protein